MPIQNVMEAMIRKSSSLAEPSQPSAAEPEVRIGTSIRHARMTLGLRLQDIAARVGCSESLISSNRKRPDATVAHHTAPDRRCTADDRRQALCDGQSE